MEVKYILQLIIVPLKAFKSNLHRFFFSLLFSMRANRSQDIQKHVFFLLNHKCYLAVSCTYIVCSKYSDPPQPVNLSSFCQFLIYIRIFLFWDLLTLTSTIRVSMGVHPFEGCTPQWPVTEDVTMSPPSSSICQQPVVPQRGLGLHKNPPSTTDCELFGVLVFLPVFV